MFQVQALKTASDDFDLEEFTDTCSLLPVQQQSQRGALADFTWQYEGLLLRLVVGGAVILGASIVATATLVLAVRHSPLLEHKSDRLILTEQEQLQCSMIEENVDYESTNLSYNVGEIKDAVTCCDICGQDPQCGAWTWSSRGICLLKVLDSDGHIVRKVNREGVVSGLPRRQQPDKFRDLADMVGLQRTATNFNPLEAVMPAMRQEPSIFCFTFILSSDIQLITFQHQNHAGIFACDSYVVYTNRTMDGLEGINTGSVQRLAGAGFRVNLSGGQSMVASVALWKAVVSDGQYARHNWTVKVDADTVFLPSRLRPHLMRRADGPEGIYLNNCKHGLRGALQIMSRKAVANWGLGSGLCLDRFHHHRDDAPRHWDEGLFLDWCLPNVLGVTRQESFGLLVDRGCAPLQGWMACTGDLVVAYHPFRNLGAFAQCLFAALDW